MSEIASDASAKEAGEPGIAVTDKMISAGLRALEMGRGSSDDFSLVREVYTAMRAACLKD